jgi:hypothetical protein
MTRKNFKCKTSKSDFWKKEKKAIDGNPSVNITLFFSNIALIIVPVLIGIDNPIIKSCDAFLHGRFVWYYLILAGAVLLGWEKIVQKYADIAIIHGLLGGDGDITNVFFGCMESVVLEKRNTLLKGLNKISTDEPATLMDAPLKLLFDPKEQINRLSDGILGYFKTIYKEPNGWCIRIAQIENGEVTNIMVRSPKGRNETTAELWNSKKSAFTRFLKSKKRTHIEEDVFAAVERGHFIARRGEEADLKNRSLILHKIRNTKNNATLLIVSIMSPPNTAFKQKLEKPLGDQLDHFGDRLGRMSVP